MIKRCIAYGAAMLVILYTFLIYDAEVLSAILILSILYPILSLSWLALTRKSLRTERDRVPEMGEEGKEIRKPDFPGRGQGDAAPEQLHDGVEARR